jgi:type I restriction enzyme S subunit
MSNWQKKKLGDVCNIELGKTPYRKDKTLWDVKKETKNVWLSIADLLNTDGSIVNDSKEYISDKAAEDCKTVKKGTLLVSFKLTLGRLAFAGRDLFTNEAIAALTIKNEREIDNKFLYKYLSFYDWEKAAEGDVKVKGKTLNKSKLKEIEVIFPNSLVAQERIVSHLDRAFAAIDQAKANADKNLQNAKELFESYLRKVLDELALEYNQTTLGASCKFFNGKAHEKEIDIAGDYIVVNSKFISSEGETIKKTANQMFPLFTNDIVMVMSDVPNGKALAKCAIIDVDNLYSLNQRICCIRSDNYDTKFLYYQLNRHPYLLAYNNGENQTNLRKGDILNTPLTLPEIKVQRAVASKLDEVKGQAKQLENTYQKKVNDLEELKRSILEKAFKGELVIDTELETT